MSIWVTGYSDDLIEVEGDINEEFVANLEAEGNNFLAFSNGVVLKVTYADDGYWLIRPVANKKGDVEIEQGSVECDWTPYSDRATLVGDGIKWVVHGTEWVER